MKLRIGTEALVESFPDIASGGSLYCPKGDLNNLSNLPGPRHLEYYIAIDNARRPSKDGPLQPQAGSSTANSLIRSIVSGGTTCGSH